MQTKSQKHRLTSQARFYRLLVIDDEPTQLKVLAGFLQNLGFAVETATTAAAGLALVKSRSIDLVLTDYKMPDQNGLEVLKQIKRLNPEIDVVMMTAFGSVETATEAMKAGAIDYLTKPIDLDQLELIVKKIIDRRRLISENQWLREQLAQRYTLEGIVSKSPEMERVVNLAARVAPSNATVLIRGESGTGKELIARALHAASPRKDQPFVALNCAALTESLLESELFGHEKGAFTGATRQKKGRFELAHGGTLFIDEVGDIPPAVQVKLLRAIQEQAFERVGGTQTLKVDVRIIAATHRDLEKMIREGQFRDDLYYRLNVVSLEIPPLRERRSDIPHLIKHFLKKFGQENQKPGVSLSKEAMDLLMKYDYPGNVRELENIIEQAVVLCRDDLITSEDLPMAVRGMEGEASISEGSLEERLAAFEKKLILEALERANGIQTRAAKLLGISERHLRYRMKKHGMK
ncbi:MAG: sigma-54-dependent Fis family transcriptional regulator [Calditrichaeota bacterium]|nr:MAG: sigma-54-dependent Fis family transcriptional regulator [Calditrichota bacterium]